MRDKYYVWDGKELSGYFERESEAREKATEGLAAGREAGLILKCVAVAKSVVVFDDLQPARSR